jgi:DinB superfamily
VEPMKPAPHNRRQMPIDPQVVEQNKRELERMRAIVERCSDKDLERQVNEHWTVAGVLGHIAFWDVRAIVFAQRLERGQEFTAADAEPEDVDWINDSTRPLIHAIAPREAARIALQLAQEADQRVAPLDPQKLWPADRNSPLNPHRAGHRGEHLDEIEAALARG